MDVYISNVSTGNSSVCMIFIFSTLTLQWHKHRQDDQKSVWENEEVMFLGNVFQQKQNHLIFAKWQHID